MSILLRNVFFCLLCTLLSFLLSQCFSCGNLQGLIVSWSVVYAITPFFLYCLSVQLWCLHRNCNENRDFSFCCTYFADLCRITLSHLNILKHFYSLQRKSKETCKNTHILKCFQNKICILYQKLVLLTALFITVLK